MNKEHDKSRNRQDFRLWIALLQACDAMSRVRDAELRRYGLSITQSGTLDLIKRSKEPVSPAMLSRWLLRKRPSVKVLLDRMEREGLVRQHRDLPRRNEIRVVLTEKGGYRTPARSCADHHSQDDVRPY